MVLRKNPSTPASGGGPPPFCKGGFALRGTLGVGRDDPGAPSPEDTRSPWTARRVVTPYKCCFLKIDFPEFYCTWVWLLIWLAQ